MQIQQLSVFVENKPGRLAEITEVLAAANIDIRAISVADTSDFGILRVIVDKPKEAIETLKEHGMTVSLTNVIAVGVSDHPGESPLRRTTPRSKRPGYPARLPDIRPDSKVVYRK